MSPPTVDVPTESVEAAAPASEKCEILPTRLGRYRVLAKIGQGGFGTVYKGYDEKLRRDVAIKVPHRHRVASASEADSYLAEARILARLDHPGIVPVYDVGRTDDGLCYLVSKLVEGSDLAKRMRQGRGSFADSVHTVIRVAEALHHAHHRGLIHRDIKPANILIDSDGQPVITDFGLAMREEDFVRRGELAGTPAYMSPEQARCEGHRVDARTDIFSLGVVFYEVLTGQRPFAGNAVAEVLEQIKNAEPRALRQLDVSIPKDLDRICLKALSKRMPDRYSTALDLAEDLRAWQTGDESASPINLNVVVPPAPAPAPQPAPPAAAATSTLKPALVDTHLPPAKIVSHGLRSFGPEDAEFFLELLPGPRGRTGLPDSISFWKSRMESAVPDRTFSVGLLYGPSGCGKSSLVKAGLLPRLAEHVMAIYVEATPADTEVRLRNRLCQQCAGLKANWSLVESLGHLRRHGLDSGQKLVIVLDQFEQWLHVAEAERGRELRGGAPPVRRSTRAVFADGSRRLLDGGHAFHARPGNTSCRRSKRGGSRPVRCAARPKGSRGIRPGIWPSAGAPGLAKPGSGAIPGTSSRRAEPGRQGNPCAALPVLRNGEVKAVDARHAKKSRRGGGDRRYFSRGNLYAPLPHRRSTACTKRRLVRC